MSNPVNVRSSITLADNFLFGQVPSKPDEVVAASPPSLGPLAAFTGDFAGNGFNTIFRPDSPVTPTPLPIPVGGDNILELNLTSETLSFSQSLGSVPNRGMVQADAFLNGVPYVQSIQDITNPAQPVGIHFEPGIWIIVPPTTDPAEPQSVARMASIPHGTTIDAQGTALTIAGPPNIPPVDITPSPTGGGPPIRFPSQTASAAGTARLPQDLTPFIAAGTITQAILDDPNTVLRNHIQHQKITSTTVISIATKPAAPLFGGGTDNIAFLLGDNNTPLPNRPNAQSILMNAVFWIETVEHTIHVPIFTPGQPPLLVKALSRVPGPAPRFSITPPMEIREPRSITFTTTQIQYSQVVFLNFNGLTWPHVSVATLVPADAVVVPPSAW
jgi:hypothetical protein